MHLLHVFEFIFGSHLDNMSYTKKQFLKEVKEALTSDKLLGFLFSKAFLFILADAFPLSRKIETFGLIFLGIF